MTKFLAVATDYLDFDPSWEQEQLEAEGIDFRALRLAVDEGHKIVQEASDAQALVVASVKIDEPVIASLPKLRFILRLGVGIDNVDVAAATRRGITVANMPTYCTREVAEHAVALLMACARHVCSESQAVRSGTWTYKVAKPLRQLRGKTLGVVGCGRIGSEFLRLTSALGMRRLVYDPYVPTERVHALRAEAVPFDQLLHESDYISVHVPLTEETYHMFDRCAFGAMKNGSVLVNTARGPVLEENALVEALKSGKLRCAALDVTEAEPLPVDSPLRSLENLVLTPHMAWYSEDSLRTLREWVVDDLRRFVRGERPRSVVNPEVIESRRSR